MRSVVRVNTAALVLCTLLGFTAPASAQYTGFQLNRFEPTAAGESSFWVDHPWYSKTRYFAAGLSLNYAHDPFVLGQVRYDGTFAQSQEVIAHQLTGHFDLAGSFLDRVLLTLSLPVVLLERGETASSGGVSPSQNVTASDPRFGAMVRLYGQPYESPISVSVGGNIWVPLGAFSQSLPQQSSDQAVRGSLRAVLAGFTHHVLWAFNGGVMLRSSAMLGTLLDPIGATAGSELQLGGAVAYADMHRRFSLGTELVFATALNGNAFQYSSSLEVLFGGHYNLFGLIQIGIAGGFGALRQPGTPDGRFLFRIAYAPLKLPPPDRDRDGVPDKYDMCPNDPKGDHPDPSRPGCPAGDKDGDGVLDPDDQCPEQPKGDRPDAQRPGCPVGDEDKDGVLDPDDLCPETPQGAKPDPQRPGCPAGDKDKDGVIDPEDLCPETAAGSNPDPQRPGCPAGDKDGDGVQDPDDQCPETAAGPIPDPAHRGCPAPDRDDDAVLDPVDACPDQSGAPSADPKTNGCPSSVIEIKGGRIILKETVAFASKKDTFKKHGDGPLQALADALQALPNVKKVRIEEQPDDATKDKADDELRLRRAKSVANWLSAHGVAADKLEAKSAGANLQLIITDPPRSATPPPSAPAATSAAPAAATPAPAAPTAPAAPAAAEPVPAAGSDAPAVTPAAPAAGADAAAAPAPTDKKGKKAKKPRKPRKPKP